MRNVKLAVAVLATVTLMAACKPEGQSQKVTSYTCPTPHSVVEQLRDIEKGLRPKNIIVMIGDGMGLEQLSTAWVANHGSLNIDRMPYVGLQRTWCSDYLVTDSAAAGTALSTGHKTNKGRIATSVEGEELCTMTEKAKQVGMRTGVAVVCRLNDATPATFCTHDIHRDNAEAIVADYATCGVDFIAGGGMNYWRGRSDERDILAEMKAGGYTTCTTHEQLMAAETLPVVGVLAPLELPAAIDSRGDMFRTMVSKSLDLLDQKGNKGFFLMVEGSCIDDWLHANRVDAAVEEILDFDRVLGDVLQWAAKDGQTLVVVTADHATGAMTLVGGDIDSGSVEVHFANEGHNGIMVPFFAYGAGAEQFEGVMENNQLSQQIAAMMQ